MVENESFIRKDVEMNLKNSVIVIDDANYKSSRTSNVNFSTNYLPFGEQLILMLNKTKTQYLRNIKILIFMLIAPIFFLGILQVLQNLSDYYQDSITTKNPETYDLNNIDLKCGERCTSLGIALIV